MKKLIILLVLIVVGTTACKKEKLSDNKQNSTNQSSIDSTQVVDSCGCGDISGGTITNHSGVVRFKTSVDFGDTVIYNQLWISSGSPDVGSYSMICSCDCALPSEIIQLKSSQNTDSSINIIYSGELKKPCWNYYTVGGGVYEIVLTNIEIQ